MNSYGAVEKQATGAKAVNSDQHSSINKSNCQPFGVGIVGAVSLVFLVLLTAHPTVNDILFSSSFRNSHKAKSADIDDSLQEISRSWFIYKHTTSITAGSYLNVQTFVNQYITDASDIYDLGCNETFKIVANLVVPTGDSPIDGLDQMHWVDSSTFTNEGFTVGNWSEYIASLGYDNFNMFMYNKIQLYVPDVSLHYNDLSRDGVSMILRLSTSVAGTTLDTAHVTIPVHDAGHFYEIVGPSSSLSADQLTAFSAWSDDECPSVHSLPYNIDAYAQLYDTTTYSSSNTDWQEESGKYVPMAIAITTPTNNMNHIRSTMDVVFDATFFNYSVTNSGVCEVLSADFYGTAFGPYVRYVSNSVYGEQGAYNVGDWEDDVWSSHQKELHMDSAYSNWNRYLDTHIGVLTTLDDGAICDANLENIDTVINDSALAPKYSMRDSEGVHFYCGMKGLKAWEFNLFGCNSSYTDICGCLDSNNEDQYEATYGETCKYLGTRSN